jgi:predicted DCC family thiol-disulfide oxidoreductase YuxK
MHIIKLNPSDVQPPVTLVYDSEDSAAAEEVRFLKSKNRESRLMFVDLSASDRSASDYGIDPATMKDGLAARDAADHVYTGLKAIYAAHMAIGLGAWFEMCRLPGFLSVGTGIRPE